MYLRVNSYSHQMDMMKAVADVESPQGEFTQSRHIPPPRVKNSVDRSSARSVKKKKKNKDVDIYSVIGNPIKMSEEPFLDDDKREKRVADNVGAKGKRGKAKKKGGQRKGEDACFSDESFSISSYGGNVDDQSLCSLAEGGEDTDSNSSFPSNTASFEGREGFAKARRKEEIMQEKIEMLTRISSMSRMGFTATRKWSMKDDIDEIRFECYRMTRENNSRKSVKNMQHILITAATIVEFANSVVNPFNLKLSGFSKSLMLTVSDYDDSLEELHHKWSGRTSVGPEMTVLFTFVTSAIFHHAGNVASCPPTNEGNSNARTTSGRTNKPDISSVFSLFSKMIPKPSTSPPSTTEERNQSEPDKESESMKKRRPMKGPSGNAIPFADIIPSMQVPK